MSDPKELAAARWLRRPEAIRARCGQIFAALEAGQSAHFVLVPEKIPEVADFVATVIRATYPDLAIPYHSRWRHFSAGGRDRWADLARITVELPADRRARLRLDLAVTSVLLDAGAGPAWHYRESGGDSFTRSEGLAVASFRLFTAGGFSARPDDPLRADAAALQAFEPEDLARAFQVTADNPLNGLAGRAALLNALGRALAAAPQVYGQDAPRVGRLYDYLAARAGPDGELPAPVILETLLATLGPIWPGRLTLGGHQLGDVWRHPAARAEDPSDGLVPFHKLSQWLAYSLVEPLEEAGLMVTELDALTGLAEYRNGGLMIDGGLLRLKDPAALSARHPVGAELIVEWRALTVVLLDRLAEAVRGRLGKSATELPLAKVLEGGTWSAGRKLARERRPNGGPPLAIISDGTVF